MEISLTTFSHCIMSLKQILKVSMTRSTFQWSFYLFVLFITTQRKSILYRLSSTSVDHLLDFLKSLSFSKSACSTENMWRKSEDVCTHGVQGQAESDSIAPGAWLWIKAWFKAPTFPGDAVSYSHALPAWSPAPSAGGLCLGFIPLKFLQSLQSRKPDPVTLLPANCQPTPPPPSPRQFPSV